jgi:hypothetical protein
MNYILRGILIVIILAIGIAAQDNVSLQMSLDRATIDISENATLTISISGATKDVSKPELPDLSMFNVYSQGSSTNISIVNGKMESSYSYQYLLQPKKAGVYSIKAASGTTSSGQRISSNQLTLTVVDASSGKRGSIKEESVTLTGENKDIFLMANVDKKYAYVNEQITLRIKFYHAVQLYSQPEYTAPQTTDFWTDMLEPQKTYYQTANGQRYRVVEIASALFPTRSGELTIGPAMVTATIPVKKAARRNDPFSLFDDYFTQGESKTVRSKPLTVKILPLPQDNKPSDYSGTVGDYSIQAVPDKTTVEMNQPVTVTYKINGAGNIKTVAEPKIEELMDFRVYRASSDEKISKLNGIVGGTKIFEEVYIPKRAGKLLIPAVKLDFFNPTSKKYKSIATSPIELQVIPSSGGDYAAAPMQAIGGRVVESNAKDIFYIKMEPGKLDQKKQLILFTPIYLLINAIPVLIFGVVLINHKRRVKLTSDIGYARSRAAKKLARKHLSAARKMATPEQASKLFAEIRKGIFSYVADKLNISPHGLTGDGLLEILREAKLDEALIERARDLLRRADIAQYSSVTVPQEQISQSLSDAEELLVKLEEARIA